MSANTGWRLLLSVVAIGFSVFFITERSPQLGLDLKGGTQVVLDLVPREGQQLTSDAANRTLEVMRRRVDSLGVTEPSLAVAGDRRIIVELPGVTNPDEAVQVIGSTAQLTFHPVVCTQAEPGCIDPATAAALSPAPQNAGAPGSSSPPTPGAPTGSAPPAPAPPGAPTSAAPTSAAPTSAAPTSAAPTSAAPTSAAPSTTAAGLGAEPDAGTVLGQANPAAPGSATPAPAGPTVPQAPVPGATAPAAAPTVPQAPGAPVTPAAAPSDPPSGQGALIVPDDSGTLISLGPSALDGGGVGSAEALPPDGTSPSWSVNIKFKGEASGAWTKLTGAAACAPTGDPKRRVAIVLDRRAISSPEVSADGASPVTCGVGITGGQTVITGNFTQSQAKNLELLVSGGALPVDVKLASQQTVGPELGKSAIDASRNAVIIGGVLTLIFILVYYRLLGLIAAVALGAYGVISYATLIGLNLTLTLPGIAGFVLAIGMAMDSNVLVYERVKEEHATGRTMRTSAHLGFKNALSAIIDSNATTFLAALTLFFFAIGAVRGFGVTLLVGTAVSIFTTLVVMRALVEGVLGMNWARNRPRLLGMHVGQRFRTRMAQRPPDIIGVSKYFLAASGVVLVLSLLGIGLRGINYGIEFTGGRLIEYSTKQPVPVEQARTEIGQAGFPRAVVQRSGNSDTSIRIAGLNKEQEAQVTDVVKRLGGGEATKLRDETIGPSFGKELKRKAITGLIIGVALQLVWVAIRFRWTFGIGAVVAMIYDALLVLGLFAWLQKPFDAVFLASLLTIIAFSVNDSVVVFDRIREQRRRRAGEPFSRVVSDACAQTFPRTVNLSLSAIFILGALLILGGQTLGDFSLAILIGVVSGIYSSVMIASPIAVALEKWRPGITARPTGTTRRPTTSRTVKTTEVNGTNENEGDDEPGPKDGSHSMASSSPRPTPRGRKKPKKKK